MTKARAGILVLLSMSSALSAFWGFALERASHGTIVDFKIIYYGAQCLMQHRDPYNENQLMNVYLAEGGELPANSGGPNNIPQVVAQQVYLPPAFFCIAPFTFLPWWAAHLLWAAITMATFTVAAFLMWVLTQNAAPNAAFYLIAFLLANCGILYAGGNPAGLAIALCVTAVWCFLRNKFVWVGVVLLALSLDLKPHDTGFVWLYFLLAGGAHRKRALQTLALTVALALPSILWISHVSPLWIHELSVNLHSISVRGGINDPGPSSIRGSGGGTIIDLQTIISVFRDDPRFYNPVTYFIFGSLLLVWMIITVRARASVMKDYLALAIIAALSMLPIYHRPHDAKLLLLTLPACAMLLAEGGRMGKIVFLLNSLAILITSDLPLAMLALLTKDLHFSTEGLLSMVFMIVVARPMPIILLALGSLYLWVYKSRCMGNRDGETSSGKVVLLRDDQAVSR